MTVHTRSNYRRKKHELASLADHDCTLAGCYKTVMPREDDDIIDSLLGKISAVRKLHHVTDFGDWECCASCATSFPCATLKVINGD